RRLDLLRQHLRVERLLLALLRDRTEPVEDAVDAVAGEEAHEVVLGGDVEERLARVTLAAGAAAELVVDPARLVALGTEDEKAAQLDDEVPVGLHLLLDPREQLIPLAVVVLAACLEAQLEQREVRPVL